jgi:hypothetical protein
MSNCYISSKAGNKIVEVVELLQKAVSFLQEGVDRTDLISDAIWELERMLEVDNG